ncbi:MAG: helix-turn-helix domain-containing protein [Caulobacteraceae bacterium]
MAILLHPLFELIEKARNGDKEALYQILIRFKPLIVKYGRDLKYPEAESDLIIAIIELVKEMKTDKFIIRNEGAIINYIHHSLKNRKIDLFRKYCLRPKEDFEANFEILPDSKSSEAFEYIILKTC